jgi:hypothetical protein
MRALLLYQSMRSRISSTTAKCSTTHSELRLYIRVVYVNYSKMFEQTHEYSEYLSVVKNLHLRATLTRFRSVCHWFQVNEGRYSDVPKQMRFCPNCPLVVEDEGHFLIQCPAHSCIRENFEHLELHSFNDVAKLFKECSDYKELAKFMVLCHESRSKLLRS